MKRIDSSILRFLWKLYSRQFELFDVCYRKYDGKTFNSNFVECHDENSIGQGVIKTYLSELKNHSIERVYTSGRKERKRNEGEPLIRPVGKWSERNRSDVVRAMHFYCIIEADIRWNAVSVVASSVRGILKHCKLHLLAIVVGYALYAIEKNFVPSVVELAPWFCQWNSSFSYFCSSQVLYSHFVVIRTEILVPGNF